MPRALKVFRTPIGFHDAYVAAPTKKAALAAWGSTHDLFARGVAEIVTDPSLTEEPLAQPGVVLKRSRGTTAEQIAALPAVERPAASADAAAEPETAKARRPAPTKANGKPRPVPPRPSPQTLEAAEAAVADAERRHAEENRALDREQAALDRKRRDQTQEQAAVLETLRDSANRAKEAYAAALKRWRAARTTGEA